MKINYFLMGLVVLVLVLAPITLSYKMEPGESATHQKITKESVEVWPLIPTEIKNHSGNSIDGSLDPNLLVNFDPGDDIITGSGEEDRAIGTIVHIFGNHFWDADDPNTPSMLGNDDYNDGLRNFGSSYRRALELWRTEVVPSYLKGDINRSYYYLGRVAHLLEDATQPGHVLNDAHPPVLDPSFLEDFAGNPNVYNNYDGLIHQGKQYNYENLIQGFNWSQVQPTRTPDNLHPELFRLFWYTAQKTQYWASDDVDGNRHYVLLNGSNVYWACGDGTGTINLWQNESLDCSNMIIYSSQLNSTSVEQEANATIPHSMKAVAGLYRLFDDAVRIDWPTVNHDYRRTGFTLLKGDLQESNKVTNRLNFFLDAATGTEQVVKPSIADIDGDELMDQIIMVHKTTFNTFTKMYGLETGNFFNSFPRRIWNNAVQINGGAIYFPATLANIDSDKEKEIITGTRNGTVYAFEVSGNQVTQKWVFRIPQKFSPLKGIDETMFNGGSAVVDIDLDGDMEVILADVSEAVGDGSFPGEVYVLYGNNGSNKTSYIFGNGGAYDAVSVANIDSDDYPEIVVAARYGIKVLDYNPSTNQLTEKSGCSSNSDGLIEGSAVIYDVDNCDFGGVGL